MSIQEIKDYRTKTNEYFSHSRQDLIDLVIEKRNLKVLEIGSGKGETLLSLKQQGIAKEIHAIELMNLNIDITNFDSYKVANIEDFDFSVYQNYFDLIICADVLEHLVNPEIILQKLHSCLVREGNLIVSVPNIQNYLLLINVYLKGTFPKQNEGIFDKTHLHFFCKNDIKLLVQNCNFKIISIFGNLRSKQIKGFKKTINTVTFGLLEDILSPQIYLLALKK